jgi:hypothetical protein
MSEIQTGSVTERLLGFNLLFDAAIGFSIYDSQFPSTMHEIVPLVNDEL